MATERIWSVLLEPPRETMKNRFEKSEEGGREGGKTALFH